MPTTKRIRPFLSLLSLAAAGSLITVSIHAAGANATETWSLSTFAEFDAGDTEGGYVTSTGEVRPGWKTTRTAVPGTGIWSAIRLADGAIIAGTDDNGTIYKVTGDKASPFATIPGTIAVTALAQWNGAIYAATMPGNTIWRIDPSNGKATSFATIADVETVWALAASGDVLYAGTGPKGGLFQVSKAGKAELAFATGDKRVSSILVASDRAIWFGTSERAIVFRKRGGEVRAMADFAGNEISALVETPRGVAVAANDIADPPSGQTKTASQVATQEKPNAPRGQAAKLPDAGTKPGADKDNSAGEPPRKNARKGKGAVFLLGQEGELSQLHALTQTYVTDLAVDANGVIFAASADKGRVYVIETDDTVGSAFDTDDRAISHVGSDKNGVWFASDDAAAIYRVTGKASQARYVSDVVDAKAAAQFGRIYWQAVGAVRLETRSGNTAQPDVGWSKWAAPTNTSAAAVGGQSGKIASPVGRYFQVRATIPDGGGLRRLEAFYVAQNQPTRIEEVTVDQIGTDAFVTLKDNGTRARTPTLRIRWKIDNGDNDETRYVLEVQREKDATWRRLFTGDTPLTSTQWDWNTETFADGWYRARVTASDLANNAPTVAKTTQGLSTWFLVDNTKPTIEGLTVRGTTATATGIDAQSPIREMAYAVDDGPWQFGAATDGIFDDLREAVSATVPSGLRPGAHTLTVRLADRAGNVATATLDFSVK